MIFKHIGLVTVGICFATVNIANAGIFTFNSATNGDNSTTRASWLSAVGITSPSNIVDFESGFTDGENISSQAGLFPAGLVISDTGGPTFNVVIQSGTIGGSNPVGGFAIQHNEDAFLELDFSASPVDYVAFLDIDHDGTSGVVHFEGGGSEIISLDSTEFNGDSAEFFGIFRNDRPRITLVQLDASGDNRWGLDNIEYGIIVPEPDSFSLLSLGALGLFAIRRDKKLSKV